MTTRTILLAGGLLVASLMGCAGGGAAADCGDGAVGDGEQCDDGNTNNGDGCSATCQNENLNCGDGNIDGNETCDDGNTNNGDGCSSICRLEGATCGNGLLDGAEPCDDGGTASGDGCSPSCSVEAGYVCAGEPSTCTPTGDTTGSCTAPYPVQFASGGGNVLTFTGSGSTVVNGASHVNEGNCNNGVAGNGNDHVWQFTLTQASDVSIKRLSTTDFDTILRVMSTPCTLSSEIPEHLGEDGCSDDDGSNPREFLDYIALPAGTYYIVIDGYGSGENGSYEFEITAKPTLCGNGTRDTNEQCDDGDTMSGDGCNARCDIEVGWNCNTANPSVCTMLPAGNGSCASPYEIVLTPNGSGGRTGSGAGMTQNPVINHIDEGVCDGGLAGSGHDHLWRFTISQTSAVSINVPATTWDTIVVLLGSQCTLASQIPTGSGQDGCSDVGPEQTAESLTYAALPAGTYYVLIDGYDFGEEGSYTFTINVTP